MMDCYSCGAPLCAGQRSCRKCGLHFPLPVPGPGGQTVQFIPQYPSRPLICDNVVPQIAFRVIAFACIIIFILLKLSSTTMASSASANVAASSDANQEQICAPVLSTTR